MDGSGWEGDVAGRRERSVGFTEFWPGWEVSDLGCTAGQRTSVRHQSVLRHRNHFMSGAVLGSSCDQKWDTRGQWL